jgi:hypothetical protein
VDYRSEDYTFGGLLNNNVAGEGALLSPLFNTLAYIIGITTSEKSDILNTRVAAFGILSSIYDMEEQVQSAQELLEGQRQIRMPTGYFPQTPVMLAREWSPISVMLDRGMEPVALNRDRKKKMLCASGIWTITNPMPCKTVENCCSDEDLFWFILSNVVEKAKEDQFLISIIAKPGWDYERGQLYNLTLDEAMKADRVIWQRKPNRSS